MERIPYQVTLAARAYAGIAELPVVVLLDNLRSLYNVGAFFRTADAAAVARLYLCGITGTPPQRGIAKTSLGAEETVAWEYHADPIPLVDRLRAAGYEIAALETALHAIDIFDWTPRFPVCLIFGNELEGIQPELLHRVDTYVQIPMLGMKYSLNVATAGGVAIFELLRKYRSLVEASRTPAS